LIRTFRKKKIFESSKIESNKRAQFCSCNFPKKFENWLKPISVFLRIRKSEESCVFDRKRAVKYIKFV